MAATPTASIDAAFIEAVRTKLAAARVEHFINGRFVPGAREEAFETLDPSTNKVLSHIHRGHAEDIDRAHRFAADRRFGRVLGVGLVVLRGALG